MGKINATVTWVGDGMRMVGVADSNHAVLIDLPKIAGGFDTAANPMELLAMALGSCSNFYFVTVLKKMRKHFEKTEVLVEATQAEKDPKVFTHINMTYRVYGDLDQETVERAVNIVEDKYCPVYQMMKLVAPVERKVEVIKPASVK